MLMFFKKLKHSNGIGDWEWIPKLIKSGLLLSVLDEMLAREETLWM